MRSQSLPKQSITKRIEQVEVTYPSVRYFQIHFEFLHEQFQKTLQILESLQVQIGQLEQRTSDCAAPPVSLQTLADNQKSSSPSTQKSAKQVRRR